MTLTGLTHRQVELCEAMWKCNTAEDLIVFFGTLSIAERRVAKTLQHMMIFENIDNRVNNYSDCKQAASILKKLFTSKRS